MKIDATTLIGLFTYYDGTEEQACLYRANEAGHNLVVDRFGEAMAELQRAHADRCASEVQQNGEADIPSEAMQRCYDLVNEACQQFAGLLNDSVPEETNPRNILEHVQLARMWMNLWMNSIAARTALELPFKAKVYGHLRESLLLANCEIATAHIWRSLPAAGTQPTVTPERRKGYLEDLDDRLEPEPELVEDRDLIDPRETGGSQNPVTMVLALTARVSELEHQRKVQREELDFHTQALDLMRGFSPERVETLAISLDVWKGRVEELENQLGGLRTEFGKLQQVWQLMGAGNPIGEDGEPMMGFIQPKLTDEQADELVEAFSQAEREERAMAVSEAQEARRAAEKEQAAQEAMRLDLESRKPPEKEEPADPRLRGKTPPPPPRLDPSKVPSMPEIWVTDDDTDEARKP